MKFELNCGSFDKGFMCRGGLVQILMKLREVKCDLCNYVSSVTS